MKNLNSIIFIIVITLTGVGIYSNSTDCSFHLDDFNNIVYNEAIQDISDFESWWNYSKERPVSMFTFVLNYHYHQLDVKYYHYVNILIHIINALLIFWLVLLILKAPGIQAYSVVQYRNTLAFLVALLFITHPLATQSVTYIIQRQNLMATLFFLLSLIFYIKGRLTKKKVQYLWYLLCLIIAVPAFLSKENAYTLPFIIILTEVILLRKKQLKIKLTDYRFITAILIFAGVIALLLFKFSFSIFQPIPADHSMGSDVTITPLNYLFTQLDRKSVV